MYWIGRTALAIVLLAIISRSSILVAHAQSQENHQQDSRSIGAISARAQKKNADLRPKFERFNLVPQQEGKRGSCQVFAFIGPMEYQLAERGLPLRLSAQFLMWAANAACGLQRTAGFNPDLLVKGLQAHGICEEALMPYIPKNEPIANPTKAAVANAGKRLRYTFTSIKHWTRPIGFNDDDMNCLINKLDRGIPVTVTFCWPTGLNDAQIVDSGFFLRDLNINGQDKSGHGVVLVGYKTDPSIAGGGYFTFQNSWGTAFADKGYAKITFDMARRYGTDAYIARID
jgi:hypothetical protein